MQKTIEIDKLEQQHMQEVDQSVSQQLRAMVDALSRDNNMVEPVRLSQVAAQEPYYVSSNASDAIDNNGSNGDNSDDDFAKDGVLIADSSSSFKNRFQTEKTDYSQMHATTAGPAGTCTVAFVGGEKPHDLDAAIAPFTIATTSTTTNTTTINTTAINTSTMNTASPNGTTINTSSVNSTSINTISVNAASATTDSHSFTARGESERTGDNLSEASNVAAKMGEQSAAADKDRNMRLKEEIRRFHFISCV